MNNRTLAIIKPDIAQNEEIINDIANTIIGNNLNIIEMLPQKLTKEQAMEFYKEHKDKSFFDQLTTFMSSGISEAWILEGPNAIIQWRTLMKDIRQKYQGKELHENAVHGSDSPEAAEREINFFF